MTKIMKERIKKICLSLNWLAFQKDSIYKPENIKKFTRLAVLISLIIIHAEAYM